MNDSQPTLPKWPFYLGDALLVAIAVVLAFRGDGPLAASQMFWVVSSIALGAVLFALPYLVEYRTRIQLYSVTHEPAAAENSAEIDEMLTAVHGALSQQRKDRETAERGAAYIEGLGQQLEARLETLDHQQAQLSAALQEVERLRSAVEVLSAPAADTPPDTEGEGTEPEVEEGRLDDFADFTGEATEVQQSTEGPVDGSEVTGDTDEPGESYEESPQKTQEEVTAESDEPLTSPEESQAESDPEPAPLDEGVEPEAESDPQESPVRLAQQELLETADSSKPRKSKARNTDTALLINALIGIGNKPYIRGEGPGLAEDKGVEMEFLEIGKWQWIAPQSDQDIRCRVYRNDDMPAEGEEILIPAGQRVSVTINFPRS